MKRIGALFLLLSFLSPQLEAKEFLAIMKKFDPSMISAMMEARRGVNHKAWFQFEAGAEPEREKFSEACERLGIHVRANSNWLNRVSIEASAQDIYQLSQFKGVEKVERVRATRRPLEKPSFQLREKASAFSVEDPKFLYGYSYDQVAQINVPELHNQGLSGQGVRVCLLDAGFHKDHEAFVSSQIVGEWDFVFGDGDVQMDPMNLEDFDDEHGTMAWSALGGYAPGKMMGPAFAAEFLLAKTEDSRSETPAEEDYWIAGLEWCVENGATVVSSSLGYVDFDDGSGHSWEEMDGVTIATSRAANIALQKNVLVVNSAGNDGPAPRTLSSPADAYGVLAVGAIDDRGLLAYFSSQGPVADFDEVYNARFKPDVLARGVRVFVATTSAFDSYGQANGTSFSGPLVAGTAALLREAHPDWEAWQVMEALRNSASQAQAPDHSHGYGIIDAEKAMAHDFGEVLVTR